MAFLEVVVGLALRLTRVNLYNVSCRIAFSCCGPVRDSKRPSVRGQVLR